MGIESSDPHEFTGWTTLSMSARAWIKRGDAIANEVHGNSRAETVGRPVASPARAQSSRVDALISELRGRAAREAAIGRAVLALEDMSWTVQSAVGETRFEGDPVCNCG